MVTIVKLWTNEWPRAPRFLGEFKNYREAKEFADLHGYKKVSVTTVKRG